MPRRPVVVKETAPRVLRSSEIRDNIRTAFYAIGNTPQTRPTRPSERNDGAIAYEYFVSYRLASEAETRKKKAVAQAVEAGVIFDHNKDPLPPGTSQHIVYHGDQVLILCNVANITDKVDWEAIVTDLISSKKVALKDIEVLAKKHTVPKAEKGAHTFSSTLL